MSEPVIIKVVDNVKAYIKVRPYLYEFLDSVSDKFELILYTGGTESYAKVVVGEI